MSSAQPGQLRLSAEVIAKQRCGKQHDLKKKPNLYTRLLKIGENKHEKSLPYFLDGGDEVKEKTRKRRGDYVSHYRKTARD